MKRSEAIFKLKHELYGPTNSKDALSKTNEILDFIEHKIKMLPPGYTFVPGTTEPSEIGSGRENKWEPENV